MKIAWILINLVHYHSVRWASFAKRSGVPPIVIELANKDAGFQALEAIGSSGFSRMCLFPDRNWREIGGWRRAVRLWRVLDVLSPEVLCVNGWSIGGAPLALAWALSRSRPVVIMSESNLHDVARTQVIEAAKSRLVRMASAGLAGGSGASDYLIQLGMPSNRIFLGYDVVDNQHFARGANVARASGFSPLVALGPSCFIASGRFEEYKNHLRLFEAFALYRQRAGDAAWRLVVLGDGTLRSRLEALATGLRVADHVIMPGFIQYDDLPAWYAAASCFVHPSTSEQWGLVVNEAMAAGLPVLASNRCGCAVDLVREGVNGFTFDPYDVEEVAGLMFRMAHGDVDREAMGRASQEIIADWGPERFAEGLEKAVETAVIVPPPKPTLLDKALLWSLIHR